MLAVIAESDRRIHRDCAFLFFESSDQAVLLSPRPVEQVRVIRDALAACPDEIPCRQSRFPPAPDDRPGRPTGAPPKESIAPPVNAEAHILPGTRRKGGLKRPGAWYPSYCPPSFWRNHQDPVLYGAHKRSSSDTRERRRRSGRPTSALGAGDKRSERRPERKLIL